MAEIFEQAAALMEHAEKTGQRASCWSLGKFAYGEFATMQRSDFLGEPLRSYMGIATRYNKDLPDTRVVLMAGNNTIGAFDVRPNANA